MVQPTRLSMAEQLKRLREGRRPPTALETVQEQGVTPQQAQTNQQVQAQQAQQQQSFADQLAALRAQQAAPSPEQLAQESQQRVQSVLTEQQPQDQFTEIKDGDKVLPPSGDIGEAFTGEKRTTPFIEGLPEFGTTQDENFLTAIGFLTTTDPQSQVEILRKNVPGIKFFQNPDGTIVTNVDGRLAVLNKPGFSPQDVASLTGQILPAAKASGLATGVARLVPGLGGKALAGGATGAVGNALVEAGLGEVAELVGAEEGRTNLEIGIAGALGGLFDGSAPLVKKIIDDRALKKELQAQTELGLEEGFAREAFDNAQMAELTEAALGGKNILFPAQKTLDPFQMEQAAFVGTLPGGSQRAAKQLKSQNQKVFNVVQSVMDQIAPQETNFASRQKVREISRNLIDSRVALRKERASPMFEKAFDAVGTNVDVQPVMRLANKLIDESGGGRLEARIRSAVRGLDEGLNLRQLHNRKIQIDETIQSLKRKEGLSATDKTIADLADIQALLIDQMEQPSGGAYKIARDEFKAFNPLVDEVRVGVIGNLASLQDDKLKRVTSILFDPDEATSGVIKNTVELLKQQDGGKHVLQQMLRARMQQLVEGQKLTIDELAQGGVSGIENTPAVIFNGLFSKTGRNTLIEFAKNVDPQIGKNVEFMRDLLLRASKARPGGSQTAIREVIKDRLKGTARVLADWMLAPRDTVRQSINDTLFQKNTNELAEAMFNPQWKARMIKVRKAPKDSFKQMSMLQQLINDIQAQGTKRGILLQNIQEGLTPNTE